MNRNDDEIFLMEVNELQEEVLRLRKAIRTHRDLKSHDRCWLNDARLYATLPEGEVPSMTLPPRDEFLANCAHYWKERQSPGGLRMRSSLFRRVAFVIAKHAGIV